MPLKGIKYIVIHLHQCLFGQVLLKLLLNYDFNLSAGKLTRLSLIAIQVVCNVYNTALQPKISHGLVCVHALCYVTERVCCAINMSALPTRNSIAVYSERTWQ